MSLLARLDPGGSALMLAATSAAIVAVVAIVAELLARTAGRRRAASRHDLYLAALALILLSPAIAIGVGRSGLAVLTLPHVPAPTVADPPVAREVADPTPRLVEARPAPISEPAIEAERPGVVAIPAIRERAERRWGWSDIRGGLALIWAVGALAMATRLIHGLVAPRAWRGTVLAIDPAILAEVRAALGVRDLPPIVEANGATRLGPVTAGIVRPVVILPPGLPDRLDASAFRDVLIHECGHVFRRDGLVGLLQRVAALIFWPHPMVHRLNLLLSRSREEACDDLVLLGGDPCRYARTLLLLAESLGPRPPGAAVVGLFERRWTLQDRVARILDPRRSPMTHPNRWMTLSALVFLTTSALAAATLRPAEQPTIPTAVVAYGGAVIEGVVVDEAGKPVDGAVISVAARFRAGLTDATSGADGRFRLRVGEPLGPAELVRASVDGGRRIGIATAWQIGLARAEPLRVVLRPSQPLLVRVTDAAGRPVAGAAVEVATDNPAPALDPGETDAGGIARFRVPADSPLISVAALKDGVGFDYFRTYRSATKIEPGPPPAEVSLTLDGARTATVRAVDPDGRPIPGVRFGMASMYKQKGEQRPGKIANGNDLRSIGYAATDTSGIARLCWLPKESWGDLRAIADDSLLAPDRMPSINSYFTPGDLDLTVSFRRKSRLSGRVVNADGSPARGVTIWAEGRGKAARERPSRATTGDDGSYAVWVAPERSYMIAALDLQHASKPLSGVVVREREDRGGLDLRLVETTTRLRGRMAIPTYGSYRVWYSGDYLGISVGFAGPEVPAEFQATPGGKDRERLLVPIQVDGAGMYEVGLAPGEYEITGAGPKVEAATIRVDGTGEVVRDFLKEFNPPPATVDLAGIVVAVGPDGVERPLAKANLQIRSTGGGLIRTTVDDAGRFVVQRPDEEVSIYARATHAAGFLKVPKGRNDIKIILGPTATVAGRMLDAGGRPMSGRGPRLSMIKAPGDMPFRVDSIALSKCDQAGVYRFTGLYPGADYRVWYADEGANPARSVTIKQLSVSGTGPIDLGDFTLPAALVAEPKAKGDAAKK